jgi:deaminated glutathione amidase
MLVAAVQLTSTPDKARNLKVAADLVREAASAGARLVVLPEYTDFLGDTATATTLADPVPGPTTAMFGALAAELGIDLVGGSVWERVDGTPVRYHNTVIAFDATGTLVARYRKLHAFDVDVSGIGPAHESRAITAGDEVVSARLGGYQVGIAACYDLRFPEVLRLHAVQGCRILAIPSAFRARTGADHWEVLLRARAIENQCYVIAAGQIGVDGRGIANFGRSMVIDPWGVVLACAADEPGIVLARVDFERQAEMRRRMPLFAQRRTDVYQLGTAS